MFWLCTRVVTERPGGYHRSRAAIARATWLQHCPRSAACAPRPRASCSPHVPVSLCLSTCFVDVLCTACACSLRFLCPAAAVAVAQTPRRPRRGLALQPARASGLRRGADRKRSHERRESCEAGAKHAAAVYFVVAVIAPSMWSQGPSGTDAGWANDTSPAEGPRPCPSRAWPSRTSPLYLRGSPWSARPLLPWNERHSSTCTMPLTARTGAAVTNGRRALPMSRCARGSLLWGATQPRRT